MTAAPRPGLATPGPLTHHLQHHPALPRAQAPDYGGCPLLQNPPRGSQPPLPKPCPRQRPGPALPRQGPPASPHPPRGRQATHLPLHFQAQAVRHLPDLVDVREHLVLCRGTDTHRRAPPPQPPPSASPRPARSHPSPAALAGRAPLRVPIAATLGPGAPAQSPQPLPGRTMPPPPALRMRGASRPRARAQAAPAASFDPATGSPRPSSPLPSAPLPAPHALTADAVPVDDHGGGGGRAAAARVSAQRPESGRERGGKGRVSAGPSSYSGHVPARHRARAPSSPRPPRPAWRPRAAIGQEAVGGRGGDTSEAVVAAFVRWRRILQRNRLPADARRVLLAGE